MTFFKGLVSCDVYIFFLYLLIYSLNFQSTKKKIISFFLSFSMFTIRLFIYIYPSLIYFLCGYSILHSYIFYFFLLSMRMFPILNIFLFFHLYFQSFVFHFSSSVLYTRLQFFILYTDHQIFQFSFIHPSVFHSLFVIQFFLFTVFHTPFFNSSSLNPVLHSEYSSFLHSKSVHDSLSLHS